jgi:HEAT repeat protein
MALIKALNYKPGRRRKVGSSMYLNEDISVTHRAAMALGDIGDTRALEPLMQILEDKHEFKSLREVAAGSLGDIGDARAIDLLRKVHEDKSEKHRLRDDAARALEQIGDPNKAKILDQPRRSLFGRPDIIRLKEKKRVEELIKAINYTKYGRWFREEAIGALSEIGDVRAVEPLLNILKDNSENKMLRAAAASALGAIGHTRVVESLLDILNDNSEDKKLLAAIAGALGELGETRAAESLTKIVNGWKSLRKPYLNYDYTYRAALDDYLEGVLWLKAFYSLEKIIGSSLRNEYTEAMDLYNKLASRFNKRDHPSNNWERYGYSTVHWDI